MRPFRSFLIVGMTLLTLLVFAVALWLHPGWSCMGKRVFLETFLGRNKVSQHIGFKEIMVADEITKEGFPVTETTILCSDCLTLHRKTEKWGSFAEAENRMHRTLEGAYRVIERGPMFDWGGKQAGERAVALLDPEGRRVVILWRSGDGLQTIDSSSLERALQYEKNYNRGQYRW